MGRRRTWQMLFKRVARQFLWCWPVLAMFSGRAGLIAQDNPATPDLRVETNLIQIPVLVLTPSKGTIRNPIAGNRFSISLNNAAPFKPKYVHSEGEDPINLAVVLDGRSPQADLLPKMDRTIAALAPAYLHPQDRVSIYVINCSVMSHVENVPADPAQLLTAADQAMSAWQSQSHSKSKTACDAQTHLWDLLAQVTDKLAKQPGWRVLLAVTNGDDKGSDLSLNDLTNDAMYDAVTIFGLSHVLDSGGTSSEYMSPSFTPSNTNARFGSPSNSAPSAPVAVSSNSNSMAYLLPTAYEKTGGMSLTLAGPSVSQNMQQMVTMLRNRYILEFPRSEKQQAGKFVMSITIDGLNAFIRPAGDGIPVSDTARTAAPLPRQSNLSSNEIRPTAPAVKPDDIAAGDAQTSPLAPSSDQNQAQQVAANYPAPVPPSSPAVAAPEPALAPSPATPSYKLEVSTKLTVEDVTVTDSKGKPVHGLTQSDFIVKEDGKYQSLRNFEELPKREDVAALVAPQLPPNVFTNAQTHSPTEGAVNILLLDDVSGHSADAREYSIAYLKKMPEGTRLALLQLGSNLRVLQDITTDKTALLAAMKTMSPTPVAGIPVDQVASAVEGCTADNLKSRLTLSALDQVAEVFAGVPGRKNLIWFTSGIPWLANYASYVAKRQGVNCIDNNSKQLQRLYGLLAAADIAVYPIDPKGIGSQQTENIGAHDRHRSEAIGNPIPIVNVDQNAIENENALGEIAKATGGLAYFARNDVDGALRDAIEAGSDYYALSYVPPLSGYDGEYHTIEVTVSRPGLHLEYRPGYTALDPRNDQTDFAQKSAKAAEPLQTDFERAMDHGLANATQLQFNVRVTPASPAKPGDRPMIGQPDASLKGKSLMRYDVQFVIGPDQLTFTTLPDNSRQGGLKFILAAFDDRGRTLNSVIDTVDMPLSAQRFESFRRQPLQIPLQFDMPPGKVFLRFGVLDVTSGKIGTVEIPETVSE